MNGLLVKATYEDDFLIASLTVDSNDYRAPLKTPALESVGLSRAPR